MDDELISSLVRKYKLHTCEYCQHVVINLQALPNVTGHELVELASSRYAGHEAFLAADKGCEFFRWCTMNIKAPPGRSNPFERSLPSIEIADQLTLVVSVRKNAGISRVNISCLVSWDRAEKYPMPPLIYQQLSWGFSIWSFKEVPAAIHLSEWAVNPSMTSDDNFALCHGWLDGCAGSHPECESQRYTSPPSRVIDVGFGKNSQQLRLKSTHQLEDISWVTLSYCWGGPQPVQTRKANFYDHFESIPFEALPATLRDAVRVTRELGVRYLWVDCLCIIQDDEDDKAREIFAMPDIYQGGVVTISAACSSSCDQGFLYDRTPYPPGVALPMRYPWGGNGIAQIASSGHQSVYEPIESRAWTFQEQILSRRILHYDTYEMRWTCQRRLSHTGKGETGWDSTLASNFPDPNAPSEAGSKWQNMVEAYAGRALTFPQDRLAAFSAIARRFGEYCGFEPAEYLAGLWKGWIMTGLLWYACDPDTRSSEGGTPSLPWLAPSWSWASVLGDIQWTLSLGTDLHPAAEILNAEIVPKNINSPYSSILSGRMTIKGSVTKAILNMATSSVGDFCHPSRFSKNAPKTKADRQNFGYGSGSLEPITIWCLELSSGIGEEMAAEYTWRTEFRHGLLLRSANKETEFWRVGTYSWEISLDEGVEIFEDTCQQCLQTDPQTEEKIIHIV